MVALAEDGRSVALEEDLMGVRVAFAGCALAREEAVDLYLWCAFFARSYSSASMLQRTSSSSSECGCGRDLARSLVRRSKISAWATAASWSRRFSAFFLSTASLR